jgi:cyanophycinase
MSLPNSKSRSCLNLFRDYLSRVTAGLRRRRAGRRIVRVAPLQVLAAVAFAIQMEAVPAPPPDPTGATSPEYGPAHGTLLIVGGGSLQGTGIVEKFIELAGGPDARIVVVPTAGGNRTRDGHLVVYDEAVVLKMWKNVHGVKNVRMLHTSDPKVADTEEFARPLRDATGVWFDGGRQWNLVDSYMNTVSAREFRQVLERGGVIGGSSAGATIQGDFLARGAVAGPDIMIAPEPEHQRGLAFLRRSAIDQHINTRNRWNDLIPVVQKYPEMLGLGLSEETAIIVTGDRFAVMGKSKVAVHDNTRAYQPNEKPYYLLSAGEVYDMKARQVVVNANGQPPSRQPAAATAADLQPPQRKAITLEPDMLGRYAGAYQMSNSAVMLITVQNGQLFSKLGPQPPVAIFPESKTAFFLKAVDTVIVFAKDDEQGRPTELLLRQNGRDLRGKRLDEAKARLYREAADAFAQRLKEQKPAPGGEARLREMAVDFSSGNLTSDSFAPSLTSSDPQLAHVQAAMSKLGALQSLMFKGVGPGGADIYSVRFEKGAVEARIWLGIDGKIEAANVRPE